MQAAVILMNYSNHCIREHPNIITIVMSMDAKIGYNFRRDVFPTRPAITAENINLKLQAWGYILFTYDCCQRLSEWQGCSHIHQICNWMEIYRISGLLELIICMQLLSKICRIACLLKFVADLWQLHIGLHKNRPGIKDAMTICIEDGYISFIQYSTRDL